MNKAILKECVTGPRVAEYLHQVKITRPSGTIEFTENREQLRVLEFSQFQLNPPLPFLKAVPFGSWDPVNGTLTINDDEFMWDGVLLAPGEAHMSVPESVCSYTCGAGEIYLKGDLKCCWDCYRCRNNQIATNNLTSCAECPTMTWPDKDTGYTSCRDIPPTYLTWDNTYGSILTALGSKYHDGNILTCA